ncbi:auxilin-related protein 2 isoform X1 [Canna indica]|uniref:Auxilin-related protein 2 isoform X1 n=1 Tax=Canna indica TaxID=4628 RepID=A0AAQ3QPN1_9LILI|nr:auxilin-related protein 2 isoform X1 [Canna indica]
MEEVTAILARDFGLRPQGKSAPMAVSKATSAGGANIGSGSAMSSAASSSWSNLSSWQIPSSTGGDPFRGDHGLGVPNSRSEPDLDDIFGATPIYSNAPSVGSSKPSHPPPSFDSLFEGFEDSGVKSSFPVHSKPAQGSAGIFDSVPGPDLKSSSFGYDDVFFSTSSESNHGVHGSTPLYEDFLENIGKPMQKSRSSKEKEQNFSGMDELIPGFGGSSPPSKREPLKVIPPRPSAKPTTSVAEDPFLVFGTKDANDLESFFSMGGRASSVPKQRTAAETMFDVQAKNKDGPEGIRRTSSGSSSTIRKASSATNFVHDFSSIWGDPPSSETFQEIEGESEIRRAARLERHQRTAGRMAKALAEKNERDMQIDQEQAERQNIAATLEIDLKRWAAGKEGNLRAMLSSLQHILWPECGWRPVSLTDLITAAAVKKVYRKANLCIHPDKVQQKGATVEQKYIAEKVFDLLKEAWIKFNSEELS